MSYKLVVEDYGKIERAELEIAPLTLFVGDNNSGKSYLLSLIWALTSGREDQVLYKGLKNILRGKYPAFYNQFENLLQDNIEGAGFKVEEKELVEMMNTVFATNKNAFVKSIFNYEGMSIGKLEVQIDENRTYNIMKISSEEKVEIRIQINGMNRMGFVFGKAIGVEAIANSMSRIVRELFNLILKISNLPRYATYYLPAARTGFMLAKNTINQVGRKKAFDFIVEEDEEAKDTDISPFPKPIIHFLDAMDGLHWDEENKQYKHLVEWVEHDMVNGNIDCVDGNSGNIQYVPEGMDRGLPLRASSGVVTELSPLILLLKYSRRLKGICYEEPEMCLHPQLQYQMARLIIRMVNSGIHITASTHSDIIIQHINNMCQLYGVNNKEVALKNSNLEMDDLINVEKIAIYQLNVREGKTSVERIMPEENTFRIPTFSNALRNILEQTVEIADIVDEEEE